MHSAARVTTPRTKAPRLENGAAAHTRNGQPRIPPLQPGDRLTVEEFRRRYEAMPDLKKAELIEGVVYMSSAVRFDQHGKEHFNLVGWMFIYRVHTPGVEGGDNATVRLPIGINEPQPDGCLCIVHALGGLSEVIPEGYLSGPPELVGEVSASTVSYDLHDKLHAYEKNRVQEYIVWRVEDKAIDWFYLHAGKYRRLPRGKDGICRSKVLPGLWLDADAMVAGNMKRVLEVVQLGLDSREHQKFVARLEAKRKSR